MRQGKKQTSYKMKTSGKESGIKTTMTEVHGESGRVGPSEGGGGCGRL